MRIGNRDTETSTKLGMSWHSSQKTEILKQKNHGITQQFIGIYWRRNHENPVEIE
jgi:hypothetical protein